MGEKIKKVIVNIIDAILEIIYPIEENCIICNEDGCYGICSSCLKKINTIPMKYSEDIMSYGHYGGVLKKLILKFKYGRNFTAGMILSELLLKYIRDNLNYEGYVITCVPLSKKSKKKRGFNQCEYISKYISKKLSIKYIKVIVKCRETKEQKTLTKDERMLNLKDAFKIKRDLSVKNMKIILVDDVTTTGQTLKECCRILKKYGADDIKLLTLAKSHI